MMNTLLKIATIITIVVATIKIGLMGALSTTTTAIILFGAIILFAAGKKIFKVTASFLALYLFIKVNAGSDNIAFSELTIALTAIILVSFGFYLIFKSFFKPF